jgi:hypothetical protein
MRESVVRHSGTNYLNRNEDFGTRQCRLAEESAHCASIELKGRIEKAIFKFGWRHGITTDEARHLLLNTGIKLP